LQAEGRLPEFLKGIGAARIGAMTGVAAALTGFFLYVFGLIAEPPKAILFAGLEPRDATAVVTKLEALNVPYEQKGDGGTILIPSDQVSKIRMQLAAEGMPSAGVGYEIFDKTDTFGTTAFVQNVNRLRALEGELARTIKSLDSIDSARVHLVIPDRQVFARDNQPPSASVVVKSRTRLSRGQVSAIQHLVAAAVAGLSANGVALVDDKGELLAGGGGDGDNATTAMQEERTAGFEDRLRQRVENIVSSIVGPGHSRVQVAAEMDFNRVTETAETFDPDSRVVRSSQTVQQDSSQKDSRTGAPVSVGNALPGQGAPPPAGSNGSDSASSRTEETINYEISKTTKTQVLDAGQVKKLSVAVVVDGTYTQGANGQRTYAPRSNDDMDKITALVRSAIGFDEKRGDLLQVTNMRFADIDTGPEEPAAEPLLGIDSAIWFKLGQVLILSITALLVFLLVVRPMIRRLTTPMAGVASGGSAALAAPGANAQGAAAPALSHAEGGVGANQQGQAGAGSPHPMVIPKRESMIDVSQIEGQVRDSTVRKVGDVVQAHPEEAMAILRTWLHQPV
jgi:flagellar M-ring protein FliF